MAAPTLTQIPPNEGYNPTRPYNSDVRPRQGYRGHITITPTNNATLSLYNNSGGAHALVVRAYTIFTTAAHVVLIATQQGKQGAGGGTISPFVPGEASGPGQLFSLDTATALTPDFFLPGVIGTPNFGLDFPFGALLPGWSLSFQDTTAAEVMRLGLIWEAIFADELDYYFPKLHR